MATKITDLNGVQKAAILLITLGPDKAANVFKHLKEDEIDMKLVIDINDVDVFLEIDFFML